MKNKLFKNEKQIKQIEEYKVKNRCRSFAHAVDCLIEDGLNNQYLNSLQDGDYNQSHQDKLSDKLTKK